MIYNNYFDIEALRILTQIRSEGIPNLSIELVIINSNILGRMSKKKNKLFKAIKELCDNAMIINDKNSPQNTPPLCKYLARKASLLFYVGCKHRLRHGTHESKIIKKTTCRT